jgi:hypothetical protein
MARHAIVFIDTITCHMAADAYATVYFELRVVHPEIPEFGGTMDAVVVYSDGSLAIVDLKYGMGQTVTVEGNPQLLCYSLLAQTQFGETDDVSMTIVQPRKPDPQGPVRTWSPSAQEHADFRQTLFTAITVWRDRHERQQGGEPVYQNLLSEYSPSEENCRFCSGKANCPALKLMMEKYQVSNEESVTPNNFDPEYVAHVLETEFLVRKHIDAVKEQAEAEMAGGNRVPGWKRIEKLGNRTWADPKAAQETLSATAEVLGIALTKAAPAKFISPAQAEKAGLGRYLIEDLVTRKSSGVKIVPSESFGDDLDSDDSDINNALENL